MRIRVAKHEQVVINTIVFKVVPLISLTKIQQRGFPNDVPANGVIQADVFARVNDSVIADSQGPVIGETFWGSPYTSRQSAVGPGLYYSILGSIPNGAGSMVELLVFFSREVITFHTRVPREMIM